MRVWLYCICRNEDPLMPYFLRHYAPWVDRLTFFDGHSDDGTREIIQACPKAVLNDWPGSDSLCDDEFLAFANERWKEARGNAEWVCWVDADEFLYHPDILGVLAAYLRDGVELPLVQGYTMVADHFPTTPGQIYEEIKTGFEDGAWAKHAIFRAAMEWQVGRHSINYAAMLTRRSAFPDIKLLHYRALGLDYLKARHARNWARVPDHCRQKGFGINTDPNSDMHHSLRWFEEMLKKSYPNVI